MGITSFKKQFENLADPCGLAVFRVLYATVLLLEVLQLLKFKHLIFDRDPYLAPGEVKIEVIAMLWIPALILLAVGYQTRLAAFVNYLLGVIVFSSSHRFEYHVFYTYIGISLLVLLFPVSRVWSIDSLLKVKTRPVREIHYLMPVFLGVGLFYYDSVFYKWASPMWLQGLGLWLPSSFPHVALTDLSGLLNQKWLVIFLSHFVLVFETVFVFLMWFRKWRIPLMIIGIGFHVGIGIAYPIPYFAATYILLYLLLMPPVVWRRIFQPTVNQIKPTLLKWVKPLASFAVAHPPMLKSLSGKSWMIIVVVLLVSQTLIIFHLMPKPPADAYKKLAGVGRHSVFLDYHFKGYNHIIKVDYLAPGKRQTLPIINNDGSPGAWVSGITWRNITFDVVSPQLEEDKITKRLTPYLLMYLRENNLKAGRFEIFIKEMDTPNGWERDFLKRQYAHPWTLAGRCEVRDKKAQYAWSAQTLELFKKERE